MNPGSPTPQAGILNQSSPFSTNLPALNGNGKLYDDPTTTPKYENLIINTLINAKNSGKAEGTLRAWSYSLRQIRQLADLTNPEEVKTAIANAKRQDGKPLANISKEKYVLAYSWFCETNNIKGWTKPRFKWVQNAPIIPTKARVEKIIAAVNNGRAIIFTLMAEIGVEGEELHRTHRNKIDLEQREISITGTKGHLSKSYKLKPQTTEMLREYLTKHPEEYPFPNPKCMSQSWRHYRNKVADSLKDPEIKKIPMKNLRNYSGAQLYLSMPIRDTIAIMRHFRHRKIETTMHYIQAIVLDEEEDIEYTSKAVQTKEEIMKLVDAGYQYVQTVGEWHIYRKRK
ncbi:tyrosine-type recombinase/integrase [Candidatus Bathyarchaeota archaeon]|nr:tyrosine-type recombinase/integrase [Candidatus Bathyarchaeota archaeon]